MPKNEELRGVFLGCWLAREVRGLLQMQRWGMRPIEASGWLAGRQAGGTIGLDLSRLEETGLLGRAFISGMPGAGLLILDADLRILRIDGTAYPDIDRDAVLLRRVPDVLAGPHWSALKGRYEAALDGSPQSFEYKLSEQGLVYWVHLAPIPDENGVVVGVMVLSQDITAKATAEKLLAQGESVQSAVLAVLEEGVLVADLEGRLVQANPAACAILGLDRELALEDPEWWKPLRARRTGDGSSLDIGAKVIATGLGVRDVDVELDLPQGAQTLLSVNYLPLRDSSGAVSGLVLSFRDITRREEEQRELRAAEQEVLGARNYLLAVTNSMVEGVVAVDTEGCVDYMNDAAEQLLGWHLSELRGRSMHDVTHSRRPDGSHFPIEECPIRLARAGEIVHVEDDIFVHRDGHELPVAYTASPFETEEGVQGRVVVFEDISERKAQEASAQRDIATLSSIKRVQDAISEERLELYEQPIVTIDTGEVAQHELLLRVREHSGKIAGPGAYLPVAEQYGLIGDIDRWVIKRAATIAASGSRVHVNVSGRSIGDPTMLDHIQRCIQESRPDPGLLVFEITETALVQDEASALVFAEHLHALGCKLALDDFGTGYCSFSYLKRFPVDYLKIDREFVQDLATNSASRHVVGAVVALAQAFSLQTVGEGVEDAETLELLEELGVDFAQGYHLGRPAPRA